MTLMVVDGHNICETLKRRNDEGSWRVTKRVWDLILSKLTPRCPGASDYIITDSAVPPRLPMASLPPSRTLQHHHLSVTQDRLTVD